MFDSMGFKVGVEVGVYNGEFSRMILDGSKVERLYSVDPWLMNNGRPMTDNFTMAREALLGYGDRSVIVVAKSLTVSTIFGDETLDFVYIDADHSFEGCSDDIRAWFPKVRPGGILSGDDYVDRGRALVKEQARKKNRGRRGVVRAVQNFVRQYGLQLNLTCNKCPSWWVVKPPRKGI
jgi:predicted O-methyltransferase YrrM